MRSVFALCALAGLAAARITPEDMEFINFITKYSKNFITEEEFLVRKGHFLKFFRNVIKMNKDPSITHKSGINAYSANSPEEWDAMLGVKDMPMPNIER